MNFEYTSCMPVTHASRATSHLCFHPTRKWPEIILNKVNQANLNPRPDRPDSHVKMEVTQAQEQQYVVVYASPMTLPLNSLKPGHLSGHRAFAQADDKRPPQRATHRDIRFISTGLRPSRVEGVISMLQSLTSLQNVAGYLVRVILPFGRVRFLDAKI